jgi:hypothetical protein
MVELAIELEDVLRVAAVDDASRSGDRAKYMERMGLAWPACHHHGRDKYEAAEEVCHRAPHTVVGFV